MTLEQQDIQWLVDRICRSGQPSEDASGLDRSFYDLACELMERGPDLRWPDFGCVFHGDRFSRDYDEYGAKVGVTECYGEIPWR